MLTDLITLGARFTRFGLAVAVLSVMPIAGAQADAGFSDWLDAFRQEAEAAGISPATLDVALADVSPIDRVIELDRRQPEGRLTFREYNQRVLSADRIAQGRRLLATHSDLLEEVARTYGVQSRFVVALWGIESSYGNYTGDFSVVAALATLAYDGRRADFFRSELLKALQIIDQGDVTAAAMIGSWAGAMGQSQFMPSSYLAYAVDHDGDGRRDIWSTPADIFASIANYLAKAGWNDQYTWGREVALPDDLSSEMTGLEVTKPLPEWQALGVRRRNGNDLPQATLDASLLHMDDGQGPAYLVYPNFRVLMAWNRSTYFAITVSELADHFRHG